MYESNEENISVESKKTRMMIRWFADCFLIHYMRKRHYESLVVWKESHALCLNIYKLLPDYPSEEKYCLCNQMRRAAYSVPMNIVEGNTKRSMKEKLHYIEIAEGSLDELDYQLVLSRDLKYIHSDIFERLSSHISRVGYLISKFRSGIKQIK